MVDRRANIPAALPPRDQSVIALATGKLHRPKDEVVGVLLEEAAARRWRLLDLTLTEGSLAGEHQPDGALIFVLPDDPVARELVAMGCPRVRIGLLPHPGDDNLPAVLPDYAQAGRNSVDYFAARGFREVAFVGHTSMERARHVLEGFNAQADARGCRCHTFQFANEPIQPGHLESGVERYDRRAKQLTDWLGKLPKPVGLLAAQAGLAGMVNVTCQRAKVAVPESVAVLSMGNDRANCELCAVPMSAIHVYDHDQVRTAMDVLAEQMRGTPAPMHTLVKPRAVITRRSTDIIAVDDPSVARAVRYIWDRLDEDLVVDDVARAIKVPRYRLERLFRKHLQRGVHQELRRVRLERFRDLLITTDQTVDELAPKVGYRSAKRLHVAFRDTFGTTPRRYRLQVREQEQPAEPSD